MGKEYCVRLSDGSGGILKFSDELPRVGDVIEICLSGQELINDQLKLGTLEPGDYIVTQIRWERLVTTWSPSVYVKKRRS